MSYNNAINNNIWAGNMNILSAIVEKKKERLEETKRNIPLAEIKERIKETEETRDFSAAIRRSPGGPIKLIAEIKKASPSKGLIRSAFDPVAIATVYESGPVSAISVLTEEDFFQGNLAYLADVKRVTTKPVLRKDFIFDEYQLYEARAAGADAVLLIAAILTNVQAAELYYRAVKLGMAVLFEIHNEEDLETALYVDTDIIGINNRDLKTMSIDLSTTLRLKKIIPEDKIVVSESGINSRQEALTLQDNGIDAMLIGNAFMKSADIGLKINELMKD
jgi:indole-3-glycerol phosphate synthase